MPGTLSPAIEHRHAGRLDQAEAALRHLLGREPHNGDAHLHLGGVLAELGRPAEARAAYAQAVELAPQNAEAQLNLGLVSLLLGDYNAGWRGYERRPARTASPAPSLQVLPWDGSDPVGRTILVSCEPGDGDSIQFARYLPLLSGRGADVVLVCPRPLVRLFGSLPGVCVVAEGDPPPRADAHVRIGSLPLLFGTTPATIPTFGAYLRADARLAAAWRERLRPLRDGGRRLLGLALTADPAHLDQNRLAALVDLPGVHCVSLQPAAHPTEVRMTHFVHELHDLADTAALLAQLDLLIVDDTTCAAHLAGALGKRCWTLVPFAADWRWALTGDDSGWYPSMRLFRQPSRGDWDAVATELAHALKQELGLSPAPLAA